MNKENLKKLLVQTIINKGGCKDIDLVKNQEVALFLENLSDLKYIINIQKKVELVNGMRLMNIH